MVLQYPDTHSLQHQDSPQPIDHTGRPTASAPEGLRTVTCFTIMLNVWSLKKTNKAKVFCFSFSLFFVLFLLLFFVVFLFFFLFFLTIKIMSVYPYLYCALNCPHHDRIHGDGQIPKCCVTRSTSQTPATTPCGTEAWWPCLLPGVKGVPYWKNPSPSSPDPSRPFAPVNSSWCGNSCRAASTVWWLWRPRASCTNCGTIRCANATCTAKLSSTSGMLNDVDTTPQHRFS